MNSASLVSCVIIFLNEQRFIEEAIESVFAQTYGNWELLLVDDGSTDDSSQIARRYAAKFPDRVRYLEHEGHLNRGMSASRNLGIRKARGLYISWLDADDVWRPRKLEEQLAILESQPSAAMVYGPVEFWFGWTGKPEDIAQDTILPLGVAPNSLIPPPELLCLFLKDRWFIPCGVMIRKEILDQVGRFHEDFVDMNEDAVVQSKVCLAYPVFASGTSWYRYRKHPNSRTYIAYHKEGGNYNQSRPIYYRWLEGYLADRGMRGTEAWKIVQGHLWRFRHPRLETLRKMLCLGCDRATAITTQLKSKLTTTARC
jgi:glycosyltransferase involved in cell wall biosynthesis